VEQQTVALVKGAQVQRAITQQAAAAAAADIMEEEGGHLPKTTVKAGHVVAEVGLRTLVGSQVEQPHRAFKTETVQEPLHGILWGVVLLL
jgi:hypothetical protein